jgi:hypothetical protein
MKESINEHDMTKKMMEIMRGGYKAKLLTEDEHQADTLSPKPGDAVFQDELKKLQDTVDPRVKIINFKIYPNDQNVIIEGTFLQRENENSGIHFKMSLAAGEIQTSMNDIDLSDKVSFILQKLKGYYENWIDEWALKLSSEYRPKTE